MAKRLRFSVSHPHTREEARVRLEALGDYFSSRHGAKVVWRGDEVDIEARYLMVPIEATTVICDGRVEVDGRDPGMLLRGKALSYLRGKVEGYLDPGTPVADLPRD